jgi:hypothetical protein
MIERTPLTTRTPRQRTMRGYIAVIGILATSMTSGASAACDLYVQNNTGTAISVRVLSADADREPLHTLHPYLPLNQGDGRRLTLNLLQRCGGQVRFEIAARRTSDGKIMVHSWPEALPLAQLGRWPTREFRPADLFAHGSQ